MDKKDLLVVLDALRLLRGNQAWELARVDGDKIVPELQERLISQLEALPDADAKRLATLHRKLAEY